MVPVHLQVSVFYALPSSFFDKPYSKIFQIFLWCKQSQLAFFLSVDEIFPSFGDYVDVIGWGGFWYAVSLIGFVLLILPDM